MAKMNFQTRFRLGGLKMLLVLLILLVYFQLLIFWSISSKKRDYLQSFQEQKEAKGTKNLQDITLNHRGINKIIQTQMVLSYQPRTKSFTKQKEITTETQKLRTTTLRHSSPTTLQGSTSNSSEKTTLKHLFTTKKPADMENDYYPFVDFSFVWPETMPDLKGERDFFLVVVVNSAARGEKYRLRREAVRKTWAKHMTKCEVLQSAKLRNHKWILVFSLGKAGEYADDKANAEEAKMYNDVLIGDFQDIYINNVIKMFMGKLWVSSMNVRYILKTDDDVYVQIPSLIDFLMTQGYPKPFYGGAPYFNFKVDRDPEGKWAISKKYFSEDIFPTFCAGAFYVLSTDILPKLFNYVRRRRPFHTDDAYLGIAARDMNITVQRIPGLLLEPSMSDILRGFDDCKLIRARGYGHDVDPPTMNRVFNRLEDLCRKNFSC